MQAEHDAKRALYMDRKLTHEQFYEWLGEPPPPKLQIVYWSRTREIRPFKFTDR
jgi:hypothetical protein